MTYRYFSGFTSRQPQHANFKRIRRDSEETKPCRVENNTKTVNDGFSSQASIYTIVLIKITSQKSKTREDYIAFYNIDLSAL